MKLDDILNDILTEQNLLQQYADQVSDIRNAKTQLWRGGHKQATNVRFVDPHTSFQSPRKSRTRVTTLLSWTSNDIAWKEYPPRDRAIIMTTNEKQASIWGEVYRVLPFNGANIAVCPARDFNNPDAFPQAIKLGITEPDASILLTTQILRNLEWMQVKFHIGGDPKHYDGIKTLLTEFDTVRNQPNIKADMERAARTDNFFAYLLGKSNSVRALSELLSPERNNYKRVTPDTINKIDMTNRHEMWTDSPCLLVKTD